MLWSGLLGKQAATESQFSCENLRIYLKLLLLKPCDYKNFTGNLSLLICNPEKIEYRKLRSSTKNGSYPCYIKFKAVLWFEKEGEAAPSVSIRAVSRHGFWHYADCNLSQRQDAAYINCGLTIAIHTTTSNLYFERTNLSLIFALSNESWNIWNLGV